MEAKTLPTIRPEFLIERNGRQFVLVAGLLDMAHQQGLRSIATEMILPGAEIDGVITWLCKATVITDKGTFTGYGDATPANVSRAMLTVLPRFCETRAIARALRWATNVAAVALEELGPDDPEPVRDQRPPDPPTQARPPASSVQPPVHSTVRPASAPGPGEAVTPAQLRAIFAIGKDRKLSEGEVNAVADALFGSNVEGLTRKEASTVIDRLKSNAPLPAPEPDDDSPPF